MYNAITSIDISQLTLNRDIVRKHNDLFSNKIKTSTVTNQCASGRCWLFAGLNVLRPDLVVKHKLGKFELSQSYLAFWDKMEKANCFLEDSIELADRDTLDRDVQTVLTRAGMDDGWWEYVSALIKKYGVVPQEIMPETHSSSNTAQMNGVLRSKLKVEAVRLRQLKREGKSLAELRAEKARVLAEVYRILVINLGEPPAKFSWRFEDKDSKLSPAKTYTPQSFWKEWVGEISFDDYVQLANVPGQEYGKLYEISHSRNIQGTPDVQYLNVKIDVLKAAALKSVLDKQPVWFAADVGKDQDGPHGIMEVGMHDYASIFGDSGKLTKAQRWSYYDGGPNHAMVLMGVDLQEKQAGQMARGEQLGQGTGPRRLLVALRQLVQRAPLHDRREEGLRAEGDPQIVRAEAHRLAALAPDGPAQRLNIFRSARQAASASSRLSGRYSSPTAPSRLSSSASCESS